VTAPPSARLQRLIVTRPAQEAASWVAALQAAGWPAQALPLIEVGEPQDPGTRNALNHWRAHAWQMDALMFVSAAAVQHFFAGVQPCAAALTSSTRCWAPGPGTARALAQALQRLGLDDRRIDAPPADAAQFDSEALWPVVQPQLRPGQQLLVIRGLSTEGSSASEAPADSALPGHGRDWLIRQCEAAGMRAQACVAYERRAPAWDAAARAQLAAGTAAGSVWLFSSSEALDHLKACAPQADWSQAGAITTHPRIAQRAREAGFGTVLQTRPALPDVLRTLESNASPP
jgi:uroporphyrinogen-III synthase